MIRFGFAIAQVVLAACIAALDVAVCVQYARDGQVALAIVWGALAAVWLGIGFVYAYVAGRSR